MMTPQSAIFLPQPSLTLLLMQCFGWIVAKSVVAVLPEQEKAMDLLELVEMPALLRCH